MGRAERIPALVLCIGPEPWFREEAIRRLTAICLAPGAQALDLVTVEAEGLEPGAVLAAARTPPFASPRRLIVIRGELPVAAASLGWLIAYARQPSPTACVVAAFAEPPAAEVQQAAGPSVQVIPCRPLAAGGLVAWTRQRMQQRFQKTLAPDAAQQLVDRLGTDLSAMAHTLESLALTVGSAGTITAEDVTALVGWSAEERVFAVVDHAIRRDRVAALRVTRRLLTELGVKPEELVGALGKHLRRLWQVARQIEQGVSPSSALQRAGVPRAVQGAWGSLVRQVRAAPVEIALARLAETDRLLKTGGATPLAVLEPFVWELAGQAVAAGAAS